MVYAFFALVCVLLASIPWTLFPWWLRTVRLPRAPLAAVPANQAIRTVSICIPACNEQDTLAAKLDNALSLQVANTAIEILVCSDGSTDDTVAIAKSYEKQGVVLLEHAERLGKPSALATLAAHAKGDAILFTDASCQLAPNALQLLVDALQPGVGLAAARYVVARRAGAASEAHYFDREAKLRMLASDNGYLFGASGAAMLVRKDYAGALPKDTIHDDIAFPLRVMQSGARLVYVKDAVVTDEVAQTKVTFRRHMRIAAGNVQLLLRAGHALRQTAIGIPLLLHKGAKLAGPFLLLASTVCAVLGAPTSYVSAALAALYAFSLATTLVGFLRIKQGVLPKGLAGAATALFLAELAIFVGVLRSVVQRPEVRWHRPSAPAAPLWDAPPTSVRLAKRAFDIAVSSMGLLVVSPFLLLLAVLIKLDSKGPVLYFQERLTVDHKGVQRPFMMWKFRTMRTDAEANTGPVWAQVDDPRVTRLGRFMRSTRLDEIPQLVNVLRGQMTIVGPRPERPSFVSELQKNFVGYDERLRLVKPGITGWAQIHCEYDSSLESVRTKLLYDLAYAAHLHRFSTWLKIEAQTVFRTFGVMVFRRGSR